MTEIIIDIENTQQKIQAHKCVCPLSILQICLGLPYKILSMYQPYISLANHPFLIPYIIKIYIYLLFQFLSLLLYIILIIMLSKSALLSVSCGIHQKYILQIIQIFQSNTKINLFLSDGNTFMAAQSDHIQIFRNIKKYALIRVQLKYISKQKPLIVTSVEIIQPNYKFLFGMPIPFCDYINNGYNQQLFSSHQKQQNEKKQTTKFSKISNQNIKFSPTLIIDNKPQKKTIQIQQLEDLMNQDQGQFQKSQKYPIQNQSQQYVLISELYSKMKNWKILARINFIDSRICTIKSGAKQGNKMLVYNFFIMDKNKNQIKCSCFDQAANKFKDLLKKNKILQFSGGTIIEQNCWSQNLQSNRNFLTIRFETYSTIIQKTNTNIQIPLNSYSLVSYSKLKDYDKQIQLDVAGIVKGNIRRQDVPNSTKKKVTLILANPVQNKQIEAILFIQIQQIQNIVKGKIIVLKNVKVCSRQQDFIYIKSHYNTHIITVFQQNQPAVRQLIPFLNKDIQIMDLQTLSQIKYYHRSFQQLIDVLQLSDTDQKFYSKINCYFMGTFGEKKYHYEACYKCFKKVGYINRSNFCQKCRKIVDIREQYVVKSMFSDYSRQIKLTLVGDYAKFIIKKQACQFVKMPIQQQTNYLNLLKFTQVCLYLKSTKLNESIAHNVQLIENPHKQNLLRINKILLSEIKYEQG